MFLPMIKKDKNQNPAQEVTEEISDAEAQLKLAQADRAAKSLTDSKNKRNLFGILFLLLTIVIIIVIALNEFVGSDEEYPLSAVLSTWGQNWYYLVAAVGVMLLMLFVDGFRQAALLRGATGKWRIKLTMKSMILGRYFDNITPSAFGGQPYQVYYLHKHKVPAGVATSLPVVCFFMQQVAFFVLAVLSFIFYGHVITDVWLIVFIIIGSLCMVFIPIVIMVFAFIPKTAKKLVHGIIKLLHKIKIVKNPEAAMLRFSAYVDDYSKSLKLIGKHKKTLISGFFLAVLCQLLNYSVTYFIVLASGQVGDWPEIIALMVFVSAASAFIPTPGGAGASESFFYLIFSALSGGLRFWGMLLWRVITFYLPTLLGLGVLINNTLKEKIYKMRGLLRTSATDDDKGLVAAEHPSTKEPTEEPAPETETEADTQR